MGGLRRALIGHREDLIVHHVSLYFARARVLGAKILSLVKPIKHGAKPRHLGIKANGAQRCALSYLFEKQGGNLF